MEEAVNAKTPAIRKDTRDRYRQGTIDANRPGQRIRYRMVGSRDDDGGMEVGREGGREGGSSVGVVISA
jgi:hypothetical protein